MDEDGRSDLNMDTHLVLDHILLEDRIVAEEETTKRPPTVQAQIPFGGSYLTTGPEGGALG